MRKILRSSLVVLVFMILGPANLNLAYAAGDKIAVLSTKMVGYTTVPDLLPGRQRLFIFNPPEDGTTGPIAQDVTFGNAWFDSDRKVQAMAGADIDGDGVDEIAVLNWMTNPNYGGTYQQRLFIFNPPEEGETGPPIAMDSTFYKWRSDTEVIAIAGVDIDGDGVDEIAVLNKMYQSRQQRLFIFNAPDPADGTNGETGPPIAADVTFGYGNGSSDTTVKAIAGVDIDGDGVDEIAVLNWMSYSSGLKQRLFIFNPPDPADGWNGETGPPIAADVTFGYGSSDTKVDVIAGVDIDGDGFDEIAVLNDVNGYQQRLFIFNPPDPADGWNGETGPSIAQDVTTFADDYTDQHYGLAGSLNAIAGIQY